MAKRTGGLVGIWSDEHAVLKAAKAARAAGFTKFDAISPFPIHGMDDAMGLKRSWLPWVTFFAGTFGCLFALWMQWYIAVYDWPLNIGGKPYFSLPAFIPVIFELTILIGGLVTVAALFVTVGLPKVNPPVIDPRLTDDRFALYVPENDTGYNVDKIDRLFREHGAEEIRKVAEY
jgi:hypothetical protein